jgi:hypothetical protein
MDLRERLTTAGIEITASSSVNDKKICLASGSIDNVYKYDPKTKMFHNRGHRIDRNTLYFK